MSYFRTERVPDLKRLPFTLTFLVIMVSANALAGTFGGTLRSEVLTQWGISHLDVLQGQVYRLLSGTFLSHDLGMLLRQMVFAATVIGMYEWAVGTRRALAMFLIIDIVGTLLVLFVVLPALVYALPAFGTETFELHDVGMSAGGFGLIGALAARQAQRWLYLLLICGAIILKIWLSFDAIADTAHLLCLFMGFFLHSAFISGTRHGDVAQQ